jgi:starch phosphorylase
MRAIHTFAVTTRLPNELAPLREIAMNLGWMSDDRVQDLFRRIDPQVWDYDGVDAVKFLGRIRQQRLDELASDGSFVASVREVRDDLERSLTARRWFDVNHAGELGLVAYFSPEFGIAEALPQYSGGLGILAGDHLKAASDLGVPLVGVGLFYHHGFFRQHLDAAGWQEERFPRLNPYDMALEQVEGLKIPIEMGPVTAYASVWKATVGSIALYLLDTDVEGNAESERLITDRLYGGGEEQRLRQELVLGIGGVRMLDALGLTPSVFHMNEGHAGFLALERIRKLVKNESIPLEVAVEIARPAQVFTTHTPVPAGIDRFHRSLIETYLAGWARDCGVSIDVLMALGRALGAEIVDDDNEEDTEEKLNLAVMSLHLSGAANGVSELHGAVSRSMFASVWPQLEVNDAPITSVTNGVHAASWVSREMNGLLDRTIGSDWSSAAAERWDALKEVSDEELWSLRRPNRERLVQFARRRIREAAVARGDSDGRHGVVGRGTGSERVDNRIRSSFC